MTSLPRSSHRRIGRGPPSSITPEQEIQLRHLIKTNPSASLRELAQSMGNVASHQTVKTWCVNLRLPYRRVKGRRTKLTPALEKRLRALKAERPLAGYKELALTLKVPVQTVTDWIKRIGLPHRSVKATGWDKRRNAYAARYRKP